LVIATKEIVGRNLLYVSAAVYDKWI